MNPWLILRSLLPSPPLTEGTVTDIADNGTVTVTTVAGGTMVCTTEIAVQTGQTVSIAGQRITGIIENLVTYSISI